MADQMTGLSQSANSECLNSWVLFGAHRSHAAPRGLATTRTLRGSAPSRTPRVLEASGSLPPDSVLELVGPLPQRRPGVQVTFFDPGRPSDFPELRGDVRPHAFGWPTLFPVRYLWSLLRWEGQCMGAVGEPRKRPHCLMCFGYGGD